MPIFYASAENVEQYRVNPAIPQSYLKTVVKKGRRVTIAPAARLTGDIVDGLLTMPDGVVWSFYTIVSADRPSDKVSEIVDKTIAELVTYGKFTPDIKAHRNRLMYYAREAELYNNKSDDKLASYLYDTAGAWWKFIHESVGTTLITDKERSFAFEIAVKTRNHPVTGRYFPQHPIPGVDIYYQLPLYFQCEGVQCKGLLDILIVDHRRQTITIVDVKTIFISTRHIIFSEIKKNEYVFQLSYYRRAVYENFGHLGYKVEAKWMFVPKDLKNFIPEIVPCTDTMMDWEEFGGVSESTVFKVNPGMKEHFSFTGVREHKGFRDYLRIYKTALDNRAISFNIQNTSPLTPQQAEALFFTT